MRQRLPLAFSIAALVVAVMGVTPYAEAHGIAHALFAHNADRVDGFDASRTPRAGRLLPLGSNKKFPASVVPPGPAGPVGPAGPEGPVGAQGSPGVDGAQGPQGPAGADGADGATGPEGPAGPEGPQGPPGADGADGATGPEGPAGPEGPQGPPGADGADGATGPQGPQGPAGADGADGATGPQGPQGAVGPRGPSDAYWTSVASVAVPNSSAAISSLGLETGSYVVWAKSWFQNAGIGSASVTCTLDAAGELDEARLAVAAGSVGTTTLVGVVTLASSGSVSLLCTDGGGVADATANDVRLVAIRVETLTAS
jgi:hypothetical protein